MTEHSETRIDESIWDRLRHQRQQLQSSASNNTDLEALAERMARRAKLLRQRPTASQEASTHLEVLAFSKMTERYGIPLANVASVESLEHLTVVPDAPVHVRGVTPWRGSILSLIDIGRFFGRRETSLADLKAYLVVEGSGKRVGVVARDIEGIVDIEDRNLFTPPDMPAGISMDWISGVHDENRLILNIPAIIDSLAEQGATNDQD